MKNKLKLMLLGLAFSLTAGAQDVAKAQAVRSWDDAQDADFVKIKSLLASHLTTSPTDMDEVLDWLMLAKYLERVADHAVNLADWAEFSVTGLHKNTRLL